MLTFQVNEIWISVCFLKAHHPTCSPSLCWHPLLEQTTSHLSAKVDYFLKLPTGAMAYSVLWLLIQSKWRIWSYVITSKLDVWSDALKLMPWSVISFVPEWRSFWRRWWLAPSVSWRWYLAGCLDIFSVQSWFLFQLLQFFHTSPLILKQIYM